MSRTPLSLRSHYAAWRTIPTRWSDNDVYGHVNNSVYYHWFDTVVNNWLIEAGLLDIAAGDPIGLVVETSCRYAAPISYPEPVEIGLALAKLGNSSVTYQLGAFRPEQDEAAAEARFTHVYVGRDDRRPVPLPGAWREALQRLVAPA